ncbi:MAG: glycosyltransferase family 4 protein [Anaerolineales bacterium]
MNANPIQAVHQMVGNAGPGNSISNGARLLRRSLRAWGYRADIYAETVAPATSWGDVRPFRRYRPAPGDLLVVHYSQASALIEYVRTLDVPVLLVYHNITPPRFFVGVNPALVQATAQGRAQLPRLRDQTILALADSDFNRRDLEAAGYKHSQVLPVLIPETLSQTPPDPQVAAHLNSGGGVNLLCVGRVAPNKRFEDVIKVLFYYRQIEPRARLFLVGNTANTQPYVAWLRDFVAWLGLDEAVTFTDHVSDAALAAYYRGADAFIYMSEHEGFGIPLVESMRFGAPVIAYAAAATPETLGGAGVLVTEKRFPVIAELVHLIQTDAQMRARLIARQHERARDFAPEQVLCRFRALLEEIAPQV